MRYRRRRPLRISFRLPARYRYGTRRYRRKLGILLKILIALALIFLLISTIIIITIHNAAAQIEALARTDAREKVLLAINAAVQLETDAGNTNYDSLVSIERGTDGSITALFIDTAKVNKLQSNISGNATININNLLNTNLDINFGDLMNSVLFTGRWFRIPARVQSVSDMSARLVNDFSEAGVNQTHHTINLVISVDVTILIPKGTVKTSVETIIPIAESIIVGKIPNWYS